MAHTYEVERELQTALSLITDVETGVRGFVISGQEPFLEPYRDAAARLGGRLQRIKELTADNPRQQRQMPELERLVAEKLEFSGRVLTVAKEQGLEAGRQLVATEQGRRAMDAVRRVLDKMQAEEDRLLRLRQAQSQADDKNAVWISGVLAALMLAVLPGAYFLIRFHLAERREAEEERDRFFTRSMVRWVRIIAPRPDSQATRGAPPQRP